jgi:hypothetical protein
MTGLIDESVDGQRKFGPGHFDLIIVDEAHRSIYQKYKATLRCARRKRFFANRNDPLIAMESWIACATERPAADMKLIKRLGLIGGIAPAATSNSKTERSGLWNCLCSCFRR